MNNKLYSFLILTSILILSTLSGFAQQNNTLLTIGEEKISSEEFLCVYNKNNVNDEVLNKETLEEYLDLYINFKLKVKEAEAQGYDTIPALSKELAGYREQLAKPYLIDEEVNKQLMEEAFSRMQYDVRASHILIKVGESASAEDTLRAYQKIQNIRKKVLQGDSFAKLAVKYSEDPSAKDQEHRGQVRKGNKGDLGYFSAFDMVYPFETAAYSIEIGSVSRPVRTKFGYHLIYLADKKETLGKIKGAHILLLTNKATTAEDSAAIKTKIFEVYKKLENGESFAALAKEYSDDLATARKGGDLGWFGCNKYIPEFTEAAYTLKNEGDFSKPFLTVYGWHILSLIEKNDGIGSFEDNKDKIKQRIAKNDRANLSKISLVADIKKEYGFNINQEAAQEISSVVNNTVFDGSWKNESEKELTATVFEIGEATYSQKDFALFIEKNQKRVKPVQLDKFIEKQFIAFVEDKCIRYEDSQLERKYPAFKSLMQEYHDGILLFELTNDLIWEKAISDTIGLTKFHQEHKLNYMWGEKAKASIVTVNNPEMLKKIRKYSRKGKSIEEITEHFNTDSTINVTITEGIFTKKENNYIKKAKWKKGLNDNIVEGDKTTFVMIHKIVPPAPKTLNEAKGLITADYQNHLETEWIKELRSKYDFKINKNALESIKE